VPFLTNLYFKLKLSLILEEKFLIISFELIAFLISVLTSITVTLFNLLAPSKYISLLECTYSIADSPPVNVFTNT